MAYIRFFKAVSSHCKKKEWFLLTQLSGFISDVLYCFHSGIIHQRCSVGINNTNQNVHFVILSWSSVVVSIAFWQFVFRVELKDKV